MPDLINQLIASNVWYEIETCSKVYIVYADILVNVGRNSQKNLQRNKTSLLITIYNMF